MEMAGVGTELVYHIIKKNYFLESCYDMTLSFFTEFILSKNILYFATGYIFLSMLYYILFESTLNLFVTTIFLQPAT